MCICKFMHGWQSSYEQPGFSLSLLHISKKGALGAEGKQESDPVLQTCLALPQPLTPGAQSSHRLLRGPLKHLC